LFFLTDAHERILSFCAEVFLVMLDLTLLEAFAVFFGILFSWVIGR